MRRIMLAAALTVCWATAALAVHDNFRENESRWYVQVSFSDSKGPHGMHYIGGTWASKELCEEALRAQKDFLVGAGERRGQWGRERKGLFPAPFAFVLGRWQMAQ